MAERRAVGRKVREGEARWVAGEAVGPQLNKLRAEQAIPDQSPILPPLSETEQREQDSPSIQFHTALPTQLHSLGQERRTLTRVPREPEKQREAVHMQPPPIDLEAVEQQHTALTTQHHALKRELRGLKGVPGEKDRRHQLAMEIQKVKATMNALMRERRKQERSQASSSN